MKDLMLWACTAVASAIVLAAIAGNLDVYPYRYAMLAFLEQALVLALVEWAAVTDLRLRVIPDAVPLGIMGVHLAMLFPLAAISNVTANVLAVRAVMGAFVVGGGVLFTTIAFEMRTHRSALGGGDIKLLAALGFALGWERGLAVLLVSCIAFMLAVALAGARRSVPRRASPPPPARTASHGTVTVAPDTAHPFAPALCIGTFLTIMCF